MNTTTPNIGWLFYKDYYRKLKPALLNAKGSKIKDLKLGIEDKNTRIAGQILEQHETALLNAEIANFTFTAGTQYPGLLAGLGAQHSIGHEEEVKLGFSFDHTTGLPYLPASSLKGLLRSYFPSRLKAAAQDANKPVAERKALEAKAAQLQALMTKLLLPRTELNREQIETTLKKLEEHIFEGVLPRQGSDGETHESLYRRDIFFDAYPIASQYKGNGQSDQGRFVGLDAITPHGSNALKNPIPLRLLKVLPEVTFRFQFRLHDTEIGNLKILNAQKLQLFKTIIATFGIGAKTNVGYGRVNQLN